MKIVVLKYGESVFNESYLFRDGDPDRLLPISFVFYLIQTENRNILVDVGCNDGAGFEMSIFEKPGNVLKAYGLQQQEITDVIITHAHHDHIEAVAEYSNAVIHIQEDEYQIGKMYFKDFQKIRIFKEEVDLLPEIKVKKIAGHSEGSSIVLCKYDDKEYVLCGDECYVKKCLCEKIPTGATISPEKSEKFVREYSSEAYSTLLFHDPEIMKGKIGFEIITE